VGEDTITLRGLQVVMTVDGAHQGHVTVRYEANGTMKVSAPPGLAPALVAHEAARLLRERVGFNITWVSLWPHGR